MQPSSFEDSNSARLSICSGVTIRSSVSSSSPTSPKLHTPKEESLDTGISQVREHEERELVPTTIFTPIDRPPMPTSIDRSAITRRRRTALLLDQPSKVIGNP